MSKITITETLRRAARADFGPAYNITVTAGNVALQGDGTEGMAEHLAANGYTHEASRDFTSNGNHYAEWSRTIDGVHFRGASVSEVTR